MPAPIAGKGAGVSIELRPPVEFILRQTGAFRRRLENLIPLWDRFEPILGEIEEERFDSDGFGEWPGLAPSTLEQKSRHGWPADPLVREGALKDSLLHGGQDKGPMTFAWGTDIPYAGYHQEGGKVAGRPPQRKVLELRTEDRRKLEREMVSWVNLVAAETWGRI